MLCKMTHHQAQKTKLCAPLSNTANLPAACSTVRCNLFVTAKLFLSNTTVETVPDVSNPIAVTFVHYICCIFYTSIVKNIYANLLLLNIIFLFYTAYCFCKCTGFSRICSNCLDVLLIFAHANKNKISNVTCKRFIVLHQSSHSTRT